MANISREERQRRNEAAQTQNTETALKDPNESLLDDYVGGGAGAGISNEPKTAADNPAGSGSTSGPETVSIEQFNALQQQFNRLLEAMSVKSEAEAKLTQEPTIPPHIQIATWLMNSEGVRHPATPELKKMHKKFGLVPCDPPAGYAEKLAQKGIKA